MSAILYATGNVSLALRNIADGDACLAKPYRPEDLYAGVWEIVARIVTTGIASPPPFPRGFQLLDVDCSPDRKIIWLNWPPKSARCFANKQRLPALVALPFVRPTLLKVLNEAAKVCAEGLNVPFSKVCRYRPAENDLLIEAGYGWEEGVVGFVVSRADQSSPQGRAFVAGAPSICNDLHKDNDFALPPFYAQHGIISTVDVVIKGEDRPYGILEIDNNEQHDYGEDDINFLTGFANVLAEAVATSVRTSILTATIDEKDRLLAQKNILAEELQHRVRNNMQLVYGMLSKLLEDASDVAGKRGIWSVARRVSTLALVYDHLLGNEMGRTTDFGSYVQSLCLNLAEIQGIQHNVEMRVRSACARPRRRDRVGYRRRGTGHQQL